MKKCLHLKRQRRKKIHVPPQVPQMTALDMRAMVDRSKRMADSMAFLNFAERPRHLTAHGFIFDRPHGPASDAGDAMGYLLSRLVAHGMAATMHKENGEVESIEPWELMARPTLVGLDLASGPDQSVEGHGTFQPDGSFLIEHMGPASELATWPLPQHPQLRYGHAPEILAALLSKKRRPV